MTLTGKRLAMLRSISLGVAENYHRTTCDALEGAGLVGWIGGMRLVGCNSFRSSNFEITEGGRSALSDAETPVAIKAARKLLPRLRGKTLCRTSAATEEATKQGGGWIYFTEPDHRPFPPVAGRVLIEHGMVRPQEDGLFPGMSQTFVVPA